MKKIAILGSTGSIGTQAIEVIRANKDIFEITILTANNNADLLIEQAINFVPSHVVIANESKYSFVKESLQNYPIKVHSGCDVISDVVAEQEADIVLTAMVGFSGLKPTIAAIKSGRHIALANKETLVVAGEIITALATKNNVQIRPVDSEHSAIFQCLAGEDNPIEKIILTASGGPFKDKTYQELKSVTKEQALIHPNWCMGAKVTIDSATLMNKGLEAIEAKWLFNIEPKQIEVVVHPQSIIHSLVQFCDGSIKAQMGLPDMRLPIQYALGYPGRLKSDFERFNFLKYPNLTFEPPDTKKFRNLAIAFQVMEKGGNLPCVMNAANEVVVEAFLEGKIQFHKMPDFIEKSISQVGFIQNPSIEEYFETDSFTRQLTRNIIE